MSYMVKEMFLTLQGEGGQAGRPAVFCRFAGCNLWSGREADRAEAICQFCDTDFIGTDGEGGGKFETAEKLAETIASFWPESGNGMTVPGLVVFTGGEPLLQLDAPLIKAMHARNFSIAVESNGTLTAPEGVDWLCISPKRAHHWNRKAGRNSNWSIRRLGWTPPRWNSSIFNISGYNLWTAPTSRKTRRPPSATVWPTLNGAFLYRPTS